ncbi:MAG: murein L,D-transpeptidase [Actinobacteria bacterium]|nr:murein L,D-transpeptidase [Actinomycetota bacterium]
MALTRSIGWLTLPLSLTAPLIASSCSTATGTAVEAAARPAATVELPPLVQQPTTLAPSTTAAPSTTVPPPQVVTVPVAAPIELVQPIGRKSGAGAAAVQQRLLDLGFWLQSVNGDFGVTTRQALQAFQKYNGLEPTESVDVATADALNAATVRAHGLSTSGTLAEVDKNRQLMFLVQNGVTIWTFNISTGSGVPYVSRDKNEWGKWVRGDSQTPDGIFQVDREYTKGWREGDLGEIYRPKYFNGGIALHGAYKIPPYPASHGCVRLSTPAMDFLWSSGLVPRGTMVWVHSQA